MNGISKLICAISACLLLSIAGYSSRGPASGSSASATVPDKDTYTLDVVIQSPLAIVQHKTGEIEVFLPKVDQHTYGYVKGLKDCGIVPDEKDKKTRDYRLDFSLTSSSTSIDPHNKIPDEVRVDNATEPVKVDPSVDRFAKVALPIPKEIVPIHLDDEGLTIFKKGGSKPTGHWYPTLIALRYTVPADPGASLKNSAAACPVPVEQLSQEMLIYVGMGPAVEDSGNDIHLHAKQAFAAERDLFQGLDRDIDYIKMSNAIPASADQKSKPRHRTSDCQAPILLVTNAD